jgi:hypothetical protein
METKYDTIKVIHEKIGETKGKSWKRYEFQFESGLKLSTFDREIGDKFKPGQAVELTVETNAQGYLELKGMKLSSEPKSASCGSGTREISIVAQTLTKCWAETLTITPTLNEILCAYRYFLAELKNGD